MTGFTNQLSTEEQAELDETIQKIVDSHGYVSNLMQTLALAPAGLSAFVDLGLYTRHETHLTPRQRLLAILTAVKDVYYGWAHYAPMAKAAGITEEQLTLIKQGRIPQDLPEAEAVLCDYAFEVSSGRQIPQRLAQSIHANFNPRQIVDLAMLTAHSVAMTALVVGLQVSVESEETLKFEMQWEMGGGDGEAPDDSASPL